MSEYGALAEVVGASVSIMSATGAVILSWKGRARWEPCEEDVPRGPQKVAGLFAAVAIVTLWATCEPADIGFLVKLALVMMILTVGFLLSYGFLVGALTYTQIVYEPKGATRQTKLIGGFRLTAKATAARTQKHLTVQECFRRCAFDPDAVWTRNSRVLARQMFTLSYLGLVSCGTVALACAAIVMSLKGLDKVVNP
jgi:hypothetical protein